MDTNNNVILLFFKDFEHDSLFAYDRYLKRLLRPLFNRFRKTQKVSGFLVWCQLLQRALEEQGYEVHLNNYELAYQNPHYPVGLVGYPHLLDDWSLPNPAILGPALLDHPVQNKTLMEDPRYQKYVVTCDWMREQFSPIFGEHKVLRWYAGMDLEKWPDRRYDPKAIDVLIYDKIRWRRDHYEPTLLEPIKAELDRKGLSYEVIRYYHYDHAMYNRQLGRTRAMIFLCEHETQGMAYQEALASNVPVLAWDQGEWLDPDRSDYSPIPVAASSVPYFNDGESGERFVNIEDFPEQLDLFWSHLDSYEPRQFVQRELSFKGSAEIYAKAYFEAALEMAGATESGSI